MSVPELTSTPTTAMRVPLQAAHADALSCPVLRDQCYLPGPDCLRKELELRLRLRLKLCYKRM